jgi:hypothetical protein
VLSVLTLVLGALEGEHAVIVVVLSTVVAGPGQTCQCQYSLVRHDSIDCIPSRSEDQGR